MAAGLLAKKAVARGSRQAVGQDQPRARLAGRDRLSRQGRPDPTLKQLGFHIVGYGCTTCIGNSRPARPSRSRDAIKARRSGRGRACSRGNRNFEGRINPLVRANYLASPPLVVAYALAGTMDIDLRQRAARQRQGRQAGVPARHLAEPAGDAATRCATAVAERDVPKPLRATCFEGDEQLARRARRRRRNLRVGRNSTYIRKPPFFDEHARDAPRAAQRHQRRARARRARRLGHHRPHLAGRSTSRPTARPAKYLIEHGVKPRDFNSYGARRGNHEVMMRGTFANIRLRNLLAPGTEGGMTRHLPDGEHDVDLRRLRCGTAGGRAADRDRRQGVRHRLVARLGGQGHRCCWACARSSPRASSASTARTWSAWACCRCEFADGQTRESLGLTGEEVFAIEGIAAGLKPRKRLRVRAGDKKFEVVARVDTPQEIEYYLHGGILQYVLRQMAQ